MDYRTTWIPFDRRDSYTRRYNNYFLEQYGENLTGKVLDLGSEGDNQEQYERMSDSIDEYIATDITDVDGIDVQADGRRLPFRDDSFDTIILSAVLEHIPIQDVGDIIAECHRILSSGGYLVAYVPFIYPLHGEPYDFYRPTKYGLHSLLESGGFDVTIHTGGGFGEAILHVSHLGCRSLVRQTGITELLLPIVPLHYLGLMTSKLLRRLLTRKMKFYDNWYVGQFVLGQV